MPWRMTLQLDTDPTTFRMIRRLLQVVADAHGATDDEARDIELAAGEALATAREYAYGGGIGPLEVDVGFEADGVTVVVHDGGRPITPAVVPTRSARTEDTGLRGLYVIGQVMDEVEVGHSDRPAPGTALRMVKRLSRPVPASSED